MTDETTVRVQAHRQNIARYRSLPATKLTAIERAFIDRRITEEEAAVRRLSARGERADEAASARILHDADTTADDRMSPG